uniref:ATP synthase CF1 delta subunit n=1 Tax=Balbiania investiens TaxID=111861 RepID=A0A4D6BN89_9FLOR|nr:ATP synthase CF1 delta subunit [Balbiania investiens]QBX88668.1 ATP synthase CF1 delta subunit [Balbiania investiens]
MSNRTLASKIALPYAEALLDSAQKSNILDRVNEEVTIVSQLLMGSDKLMIFLANPLISPISKKEVIRKLFSEQVSSTILTFMLILVDRRRIAIIDSILDRYLNLAYSLESLLVATVTTSIMFTDEQKIALVKKLEVMTGNSQIKLEIAIDPQLIGGFTIQIGSKFIDTSLRGQLKDIASFLNAGML